VIGYWIGWLWMRLFGWDVVGQIPPGGKFVLVGAPHTSNWDFPFTMAAVRVLRVKISWMGKHTIFKGPVGAVMRWLGGIPINRESAHGVVDQIVDRFAKAEKLVVAVAASGTRRRMDYWKSGFYWIALNAQVPILCGFLDYGRKQAGVGLSFLPTGDVKKDMDRIRGFYEGIKGKKPELQTNVRFRDEGE
jgi:1-acyl-sn-glycerol-3-phosphate acyltransferase